MVMMAATAQKLDALSASILKGHFIFSKEYDDNRLKAQFSKPSLHSHNISYNMTDDENLKLQYYKIRQSVYKEVYNDENVGEDNIDHVSQIFVATAGAGNVVGGIRLTVSTPESPKTLPIEKCGANLKEIFPAIDFTKVVYGEAGRSAVLPDFRGGEVCNQLQMISKDCFLNEMGAEIGLGSADEVNMRRLKKFFTRMGHKFIARFDQKVQVDGTDVDLYLWAIDFTTDLRYAKYLEASDLGLRPVVDSDVAELQPEFA